MSDFTEIVDSLENRINELLHNYEVLKKRNDSAQLELDSLIKDNQRLEKELESSQQNVQTLKSANAMLGSNDHKKETKLKINSLIREIDQCIVQLSE